jgi:hypothetical protein
MNHSERSLKHRWLTKLGWQFVEPKTLLAVYRDEQFHRLLEPGYHSPINKWKERYANKPISTETRFISIDDVQIFTADCVKAEVNLDILYQFDPRECPSHQTVAKIIDYPDYRLGKLVKNISSQVIRSTCATFAARQVISGACRQQIEGKLTAQIQRRLQAFGFFLAGSISIRSILLPKAVEYELEKAVQRQIYASSLGEYNEETSKRIFRHELLANSDSIKLRIRQNDLAAGVDAPFLRNSLLNGHKKYDDLNQSAN